MSSVLNAVAQAIFDKKGFNILGLDLRGISTMTDYCIIAEGNIDRHVIALSSAIKDSLHQLKWQPVHIEGEKTGDWLVMDYGDFIVHLFTAEVREKYALEELWQEAKIINLSINVEKKEAAKAR